MRAIRFTGGICLLLLALASQAQVSAPGGPGPGSAADPTAIPLDGGAGLLPAGGVGYGLRRLRPQRR